MIKISKSEYDKIHYWLRSNFGFANKCDNPKCKNITNNFGWALIKDKEYEYKRENYFMLCKSCHSIYDKTEKGKIALSKKMLGNTFRKGLIPWNKGKHPEYMQGENHPMWKGGRPKCIDCGKQLKFYGNKRCVKCEYKNRLNN